MCVYRDGDWLHIERKRGRYDSITTIVMIHATTRVYIPIGDHEVLVRFKYSVQSSKYYK